MSGVTITDLLVGRVLGFTTHEATGHFDDAWQLNKHSFNTPKAPCTESSSLVNNFFWFLFFFEKSNNKSCSGLWLKPSAFWWHNLASISYSHQFFNWNRMQGKSRFTVIIASSLKFSKTSDPSDKFNRRIIFKVYRLDLKEKGSTVDTNCSDF